MGTPAYKVSLSDKPDILSVLEREGVDVLRRGARYFSRCIAHSPDNNPSMVIYHDTGRVHCFSCGFHGDAVDVVRALHGLSFRKGHDYLGLEKSRPEPVRIAEAQERKELLAAFRRWECEMRNLLAGALRLYRRKEAAGFTYREAVALADVINDFPYVEYCYEILCGKDDAAKYELFKGELGV